MNAALLLPAALAALAALFLPLLIHLARRSQQRPTDFAALRWLRQKPKPRHRLRFDEWPLLLLRLLLLALLALWLARPVLFGGADERPWIAVTPGVDTARVRAMAEEQHARLHWLAPGFPSLDEPQPAAVQPIASLLRQLDAELPAAAKLTVFVPEQLSGADAQLPRLSRVVDWRVLPGAIPVSKPAPEIALPLTVRHAADRNAALRYLRAAALAWQPAATGTLSEQQFSATSVDQSLPGEARNLIWLAPGALPANVREWIGNGGTALLDSRAEFERSAAVTPYWRDDLGATLVEGAAFGRGRMLRFTRPLTPATMPQLLEPDFPQRLRALFVAPAPAPSRVAARDYAPMTGGATYAQAPRDLQPWLALLIAGVLLIERWLATRARRAISP
jgi:hypothetical protein